MRIWILMMLGASLAFGQTKPADNLAKMPNHFGRRRRMTGILTVERARQRL